MRHGSTGKEIVFPPDTMSVCVAVAAVEEPVPTEPVGKILKVGKDVIVGKVKGGGGEDVIEGRVKGGGMEAVVIGGVTLAMGLVELDDEGIEKVTPSVVIALVGYGSISIPITISLGSKMTVGPGNGSVNVVSDPLRVMVSPSTTIVRTNGMFEKLMVIPSVVKIPVPVCGRLIV